MNVKTPKHNHYNAPVQHAKTDALITDGGKLCLYTSASHGFIREPERDFTGQDHTRRINKFRGFLQSESHTFWYNNSI